MSQGSKHTFFKANNEDNTNNYVYTLPVNREMQITTTNKRHHFITITKMIRGNKNF